MVGEFEAEDLTQDVFCKVNNALPKFRGDSSVSTWIFKIATNLALDKLRSRKTDLTLKNAIKLGAVNNNRYLEYINPVDRDFVKQEMNDCIHEYVSNLPLNYRTVIILSDFEGWKNQEIADLLNISLANTKIRLHRGRALLKKAFQENCHLFKNEKDEYECDFKS